MLFLSSPKTFITFEPRTCWLQAQCSTKPQHENSVACVDYARANKSIIYLTMRKGKRPINMLFSSKAPKTQQVEHCQHFRINQCNFWLPPVGDATLAPAKILLFVGFLAKVSVPVCI